MRIYIYIFFFPAPITYTRKMIGSVFESNDVILIGKKSKIPDVSDLICIKGKKKKVKDPEEREVNSRGEQITASVLRCRFGSVQ